ncbi:2-octaprenyl-6-methoxyphenol hydroxylase [Georgfuchsia toluolica]|uniref:2-octaprenyl-6-methoxyphenol hydroxylase n=1 Tax=Georgfuchsia toluolica TaxID=424218 RepID=A0A916J3P2_9PROT|nr:FAD-dependent monooxygenase [Georgfuchsia toluolica]CAG4884134.1 2-octaprenyl-6-methoxyphenol hydroxylase [Georgfuchsia toluolica]
MRSEELTPVAIVGGGPVGMSLALALHKQGIAAKIFDARGRGAGLDDQRILALSYGTRQTLEWLGAWQGMDATPIRTIHISQRGHGGRSVIRAEQEHIPALGYVVSLRELYRVLDAAVAAANIVYHDNTRIEVVNAEVRHVNFLAGGETCRAQLVAYAEGIVDNTADINRHDYAQHAVTTIVSASEAPQGRAWERFTAQGPIALLPFGHAFALVQSCSPEIAGALTTMPATEFLAQLQDCFGQRLHFTGTGPRHSFPLGLRYRHEAVAERQVWLGNAAQTLHPVAGQGFNLALRDVRELARTLTNAVDSGAPDLLHRYAKKRQLDRRCTIGFTDTLVRLFSNDNPLLGHACGAGLLGLDLLPAARSFLARRMMFGARAW